MFFDVIGRAVEDELRAQIKRPLFIAIEGDEKIIDIRAETRHGLLTAQLPRRRMIASNPHLTLTLDGRDLVGADRGGAVVTCAIKFGRSKRWRMRRRRSAKGRSTPLRISGAQEVRSAANAFLDMRNRIELHIEQRTRMLSGVSHDLRTPLTRMKLALEMMDDSPEIAELRHDVTEMQHISDEFLAYARGDQSEEFELTDVADLARTVVAEAKRKGGDVSIFERVEMPAEPQMNLRPVAIKRCLHNLLENALAYGERAALSVTLTRNMVEFAIEDDGPGIPEDQREAAFRAFNRLDTARNQNRSSGVGLGLALALDTIRGHGGELKLEDSDRLGGLCARARLPR